MSDLTLEQQIEETQRTLNALQQKLKQQNKLELKGGDGYELYATCDMLQTVRYVDSDAVKRGAFRATKELADIAEKNMVIRNRLEAYATQLDPEWRDKGLGTQVWYINRADDSYAFYNVTHLRSIGTVYMSKETAKILVSSLNNGEITL